MAETAPQNRFGDVGNLLGLLIAGLAGIFGFVGLSGDEVTSVLRNEAAPTTYVLVLVTLTVVVGIVSIFVVTAFRLWLALGILLVTASLIPLTTALIRVPAASDVAHTASWIGFILLVVLGLAACGLALASVKETFPSSDRYLGAQPVLLIAAVLLLGAAVLAGVRLEVRSQATSTHVQIQPQLTRETMGTNLKLEISASKLTSDNVVLVSVFGLPRSVPLDANRQAPCTTGPNDVPCNFVAGFVLNPDAAGKVNDTVSVPIDDANLQHLALYAQTCLLSNSQELNRPRCSGDAEGGQTTHVDLRLPKSG